VTQTAPTGCKHETEINDGSWNVFDNQSFQFLEIAESRNVDENKQVVS